MPEPAAAETVIVVHGTFSGKMSDAAPGWYAPDQLFCRQLDQELETRGSTARCWRHLQPGEGYFHWDGANDWLSRSTAAASLRREIRRLRAQGWTVHLVGHSHGGNVVIDAVTNDAGRVESWFSGRVVLLGTPLYRDSDAFAARREALARRWSAASLAAWTVLLYLSARQVDVLAAFEPGGPTEYRAAAVGAVLVIASVVLLVRAVQWLTPRSEWLYLWTLKLLPFSVSEPKIEERWSPAFMLISSAFDEAYRSLSGLPRGPNPLTRGDTRSDTSFWSHLRAVVTSGRSSLSELVSSTLETRQVRALATVGVTAVLALLLWTAVLPPLSSETPSAPGASLGFWMVVTIIAITACVFDRFLLFPGIALTEGLSALWRGIMGLAAVSFDAQIKRSVWAYIKSVGLGLNGAPRRVEDITVSRMFDTSDPEDCVYLELPNDIVAGVTEAQKSRLAEVQTILYREGAVWSPTQLREELESVDFPLVHTTYYRDAGCVQKIAGWLCEPMVKKVDGRVKVPTIVLHGTGHGGGQNATFEDLEGSNKYRLHVEELKQKHGPPGSPWGTGTNVDRLSSIRGPRGW